MTRTALIAGAGGAASKRLIEILLADPEWSVLALARSPRSSAGRLTAISADLLDRAACADALAAHPSVTHLFYTARAKHGETGIESVEDNVAMLRNVIDAVEPIAHGFEHVHLVQGTKYYGMHLGPFHTPADEGDPRHPPPNFYYDQQDLLVERQRGRRWAWSASRPTFIYDFAPERARNAVSVIGAYAVIMRELGSPLDFPGSKASFEAHRDMTDATLLARAMAFIATTAACRNQAFNVVNGDLYRWEILWPKIARHFEMPPGEVRPTQLSEWIKDKQPIWAEIVRRYALAESDVNEVADWDFADFHWGHGYDICSSPAKLHAAGFRERLDSEQAFLGYLGRYRDARVLP